jgi:hypothetical protein
VFAGWGSLISRIPEGEVLSTAPYLMIVGMDVPEASLDELDRWYEEEHSGLLLRCSDWLQVERYAVHSVGGLELNRIALHPMRTADPFSDVAVQYAISTRWRQRLASEPWFLASGRDVHVRLRLTAFEESETTRWRSQS